ncbi:MAG: radical SAM protein [Candidatus Omnitrophota bacterium]|nr:radical SAM protein [Candidatus Omnitrophota bacterium]
MQCKILGQRSPVVAYLLLTDRCNMHCRYCFVDTTKKRKELSTQEWKQLIDEIFTMGCRMICLMGGEPLLHPDIEEIIGHIQSKKIICDMTTNGILVPKMINVVKKINSLMVSLDGDEVANDANRGKGSFKYALDAIKIARENGVVVRINAVMTKQSQNSLEFLLNLADKFDLYVTFAITAEFLCEDIVRAEEVTLSDGEIKNVFIKLKKLRQQGRRVLFSQAALDYVINYPLPYNKIIFQDDIEHRKFYKNKCPFGNTMFYVDANGDLYPCAALWNTDHFQPMNILKDGFQKAWDNMARLRCLTCFCPGVPEWNRIMSLRGLTDGLLVTLKQTFSRRVKNQITNNI